MRGITRFTITSLFGFFGSVGCIDGFKGSNIELDLPGAAIDGGDSVTPVQALIGAPPKDNEIPANSSFTLYKVVGEGASAVMTPVQSFEVHHAVDPTSPCFINASPHDTYPGLHVTQIVQRTAMDVGFSDVTNPPPSATEAQKQLLATAEQRFLNVLLIANLLNQAEPMGHPGLNAVTSVSTTQYPTVATACGGPADQVPPPTCVDDASNALRLKLCKQTWAADPNLWEGNDEVLTAPLNGTTYGFVDGFNPINTAPVDGAEFFVTDTLPEVDGWRVFYQTDGTPGPGTLFLAGGPPSMVTRGVYHENLLTLPDIGNLMMGIPPPPNRVGNMSVFTGLGNDDVQF